MPNNRDDEFWKSRFKCIDSKVEALKDHPKYEMFRRGIEKLKSNYKHGPYLDQARYEDMVARFEQAPAPLIAEWLDGKNDLSWGIIRLANQDQK